MCSWQLESITVTLQQSPFAPLLCMAKLCCLFKEVLYFDSQCTHHSGGEMGRLRCLPKLGLDFSYLELVERV